MNVFKFVLRHLFLKDLESRVAYFGSPLVIPSFTNYSSQGSHFSLEMEMKKDFWS